MNAGGRIEVFRLVNGGEAPARWPIELDEAEARAPRASGDGPDPRCLAWHRREVFREG